MAIDTYSELQQAVIDWVNNPELTQVVPSMIALAEADLNRRLRLRQMLKRATATLDGEFITLPADWLEGKNVQLNTSPITVVQPASLAQVDATRAAMSSGVPKIYAIFGSQMDFAPPPSGTYQVEMIYYAAIPALSATNTSNWLLLAAPDLYLYATLAQTAPYLGEDARLAVWGTLREKLVADLMLGDDKASFGGGTPRMRIGGVG